MYRLALLAIFVALTAHKPHRKVWVILSGVSAIELAAWAFYDHNNPHLYIVQSTAALFGGIALSREGTRLAHYQALVYLGTLSAYFALSIDVSAGRHLLIYNYFEAVIYGLVALQLMGIYPTVRASLVLRASGRPTSLGHLQGSQKV